MSSTCDRCQKQFKKLNSTVSRSGHGSRDTWKLCTECKEDFENVMQKFLEEIQK